MEPSRSRWAGCAWLTALPDPHCPVREAERSAEAPHGSSPRKDDRRSRVAVDLRCSPSRPARSCVPAPHTRHNIAATRPHAGDASRLAADAFNGLASPPGSNAGGAGKRTEAANLVFAGTTSGFVNASRPWGIGTRENGMGSLLFDPDGDGDLDALLTGIIGDPLVCGPNVPLCDGNRLYRNEIPGRSSRMEADWGLADGSWGWGMALLDADLDGDEDIVQTTGYSIPFPEVLTPGLRGLFVPFEHDPVRFFERDGQRFSDQAAARGLVDTAEGRTALAVDLDNDGDLDLALSHNRGTVEVWETVATAGNSWLKVWALDDSCQPAVGATVTLETDGGLQRRWVQANSSYLGNAIGPLHFGLGSATPLRLTVSWLDGTSTSVGVSAAGATLTLAPAGISCP